MTLVRCTFGTVAGEGVRCRRPAEQMREIPGRQQLTTYPVCVPHAEVIDRYFRLFPEQIRSEVLRYEAAHLVKEAERLIGESQDLRWDHWDDRPDHDD